MISGYNYLKTTKEYPASMKPSLSLWGRSLMEAALRNKIKCKCSVVYAATVNL